MATTRGRHSSSCDEDTDQAVTLRALWDVIYNTLRHRPAVGRGPGHRRALWAPVQSERMALFASMPSSCARARRAPTTAAPRRAFEALHAEQRANGEMTHHDGCCRDLPEEEVTASGRR